MSDDICSFPDCGRPGKYGKRGTPERLCPGHGQQIQRGQQLHTLRDDIPIADRLNRYVNFNGPINPLTGTPCHEWTGYLSRGYGRIKILGVWYQAHRIAWELANGPIPDGFHVDHDYPGIGCSNKKCVNAEHLRAVSPEDHATRKSDNTTGEPNIYWEPRWGGCWTVKATLNGAVYSPTIIGLPANYPSTMGSIPQEAIEARDALRAHLGLPPIVKAA